MDNIKSTILTIISALFSDIKYIHRVGRPSPLGYNFNRKPDFVISFPPFVSLLIYKFVIVLYWLQYL